MKNKQRKKIKNFYVKKNIEKYFELLQKRFEPSFDEKYIKEIINLCSSFNIRLKKEDKIKFCKKCNTYFNIQTREIRFNNLTKTKDYICKNCGFTRKFPYKNQPLNKK